MQSYGQYIIIVLIGDLFDESVRKLLDVPEPETTSSAYSIGKEAM